MMGKKIICPSHNDTVPSMHIYEDFGFCFVCHVSIPVSELNLPGNFEQRPRQDPTNIPKMIERIKSLPTAFTRGFYFPYDDRGFYIVWPGENYYKRRNNSQNTNRYVSPSGAVKPLFVYPGNSRQLVIIEGELNAMSLNSCLFGEFKICSPGPASDLMRYIKYYSQFDNIRIYVDYDGPGVVFGSTLKDMLLKQHKRVILVAMTRDFNDILCKDGEDAVRKRFEEE